MKALPLLTLKKCLKCCWYALSYLYLSDLCNIRGDSDEFLTWAHLYKASRESKELLAESQQLAFSLNAWIKDVLKKPVEVKKQFGFVPVYAQLCGRLELKDIDVLTAYTFTVLENPGF